MTSVNMPSVEYVVIELRQQIGCANVFLQFNKLLNDDNGSKVKVHLERCKIHLSTKKNPIGWVIIFNPYLNIVPNSLNNVIVSEMNVSFRISIENISNVILDQQQPAKSIKDDYTILSMIKENQKLSFLCIECNSSLTTEHSYTRIRELPKSFINPNEFFCHAKLNFNERLIPDIEDLFFDYQCIIIKAELLLSHTVSCKKGCDNFYCNKCSKLIGLSIFGGKAIKLWPQSIGVQIYNEGQIFERYTLTNTLLNGPCKFLNKITQECSVGVELLGPNYNMLYMKFILRSMSLSNSKQNQFLLLNIVEKDLKILQKEQNGAIPCNDNQENIVTLKNTNALKLFYKIIILDELTSGVQEPVNIIQHIHPMLAYWQKDMNVIQMDISPYLFENLCIELERNASLLPIIYRKTSEDFQISYVFY